MKPLEVQRAENSGSGEQAMKSKQPKWVQFRKTRARSSEDGQGRTMCVRKHKV